MNDEFFRLFSNLFYFLTLRILLLSPCITCVQYPGRCSVAWGIMIDVGGYHECHWGIMIHVGGYHEYHGGV